ncbi:hypothetical protein ACLX1H_007045 [Fusarium chlamydosporum]
MKFFNIITLASLVTAVPQFRRQQKVTGTIKGSVDTLADTALTTLTQIDNAVAAIQNATRAQASAQVQASVGTSIQAITDALEAATTEIVRVTTGAVGNVGGQAVGLVERDVVQLTAALRQIIGTLDGILNTVSSVTGDLTPEVLATIEAELNALRGAINPLVRPLLLFTAAVRNAAGSVVGGAVRGLESAFVNLIGLQRELVSAIGVPRIGGI